jgi:hypothetical protein
MTWDLPPPSPIIGGRDQPQATATPSALTEKWSRGEIERKGDAEGDDGGEEGIILSVLVACIIN